MHRFYKFNPSFGRKIVRVQYKLGAKFGRKICGKRVEFKDAHVKFNEIDKQNAKFLLDHLEYEDLHAGEITSLIQNEHIFNYDTDEEEHEEHEEEENEEEQEEEEEEEEENVIILGIINENGIVDLVNDNANDNTNDNANESDTESEEEAFVNNDEYEMSEDDSVS
jgi:hypothetical protein